MNSTEDSLSDDNDIKIVETVTEDVTEDVTEEQELMKSFGLPIGFTSRSANKRSDKMKTKKKRKFKPKTQLFEERVDTEIDALFAKYWTQFGEQIVDESWLHLTSITNTSEMSEDMLNELWEKNWFEVYTKSWFKFVEDFESKSLEKQNESDDEIQILPQMISSCYLNEELNDAEDDNNNLKNDDRNDRKSDEEKNDCKSESLPSSSGVKPLTVTVRFNDSDSDGPPEERSVHIKRQHESDSIDFSEEVNKQIESEVKPKQKEDKTGKKRKSKYWHQRYRLFSRFDDGIKLDNESWYSVTPERIAQHIAKRFNHKNYSVIIDAFCGAGGNTIQFASISPSIKVIAIDIDERKICLAKHNAKIYGVDHQIEFICTDYLVFAKTCRFKADAVFLSPPWGGPNYLKQENYTLDMMSPNGVEVFEVTNTHITTNIGFLLPRNVDKNQLKDLAGSEKCVEVEENLLNNKVKTVTAYFGNLINTF